MIFNRRPKFLALFAMMSTQVTLGDGRLLRKGQASVDAGQRNLASVDKLYTFQVDCYGPPENRDTGNKVCAKFYNANGELQETKCKQGVHSCGSISADPVWTVTSTEEILSVVMTIDGNDAFFIDHAILKKYHHFDTPSAGYYEATSDIYWGNDEPSGHCLSTDSNDANDAWGQYVDGCHARIKFDTYDGTVSPA